jgi:succinoglycan biosynthesis protein ExoM
MTPEAVCQAAHGADRDRISVCVCTYRRPQLLRVLLDALAGQETGDRFDLEVEVVDNDLGASSARVVRDAAAGTPLTIWYHHEPVRNISLARNRAVVHARGNLVAFIDDDECPGADWLERLHETLVATGADGVLAPVVPDFPPEAPRWLRDGRFLDRRRYRTGTRVESADGRTGNVLLARALFGEGETWFDPAFGRTGGEDSDFFARQVHNGRVFVWCDEAVVTEAMPPERWTASFHIRRLWRSGTIAGEWMRTYRRPVAPVVRYAVGLAACVAVLPATLVLPKYARVRVAQKLAYFAGAIMAFSGFSLLRHRE